MEEKTEIKLGTILYGYSCHYGWMSRSPQRFEFVVTRETNKMWILSLNGKEYQKVYKENLRPYSDGISVQIEKNESIENEIKEWNKWNIVYDYFKDLEKSLNNKRGFLDEKYNNLYEFIKKEDK